MPPLTDQVAATMSPIQLLGAGGFGAIIGWYVYYINRHRTGDVQIGDLVTLIGTIGGGAVLSLFDKKTDLFGAYGIGLFAGFFGYFVILLLLVRNSINTPPQNFNWDWFLDGRRKAPQDPWGYSGVAGPAMIAARNPNPAQGGQGGGQQYAGGDPLN